MYGKMCASRWIYLHCNCWTKHIMGLSIRWWRNVFDTAWPWIGGGGREGGGPVVNFSMATYSQSCVISMRQLFLENASQEDNLHGCGSKSLRESSHGLAWMEKGMGLHEAMSCWSTELRLSILEQGGLLPQQTLPVMPLYNTNRDRFRCDPLWQYQTLVFSVVISTVLKQLISYKPSFMLMLESNKSYKMSSEW